MEDLTTVAARASFLLTDLETAIADGIHIPLNIVISMNELKQAITNSDLKLFKDLEELRKRTEQD